MKVRATKRYVDRYSKQVIEEGTEFDVPEDRAEELIGQQAVERVTKTPKAERTATEG